MNCRRLGDNGRRLILSSDFLLSSAWLDLVVGFLLTLLADNVNHDDSEVLHFLDTVRQLAFILSLHFLEFVS